MQKLFTDFEPTTAAQWKEQLIKDLKGVDYDSLVWHTRNHFDVKPFYTAEDLGEKPAPVFRHSNWEIGEEILVGNEADANRQALAALNGGASALRFRSGGDADLEVLLRDILIEHIVLEFVPESMPERFVKQLERLIAGRGLDLSMLRIAVNYDVLARLAEHGGWRDSQQADLQAFGQTLLPFASPVIDTRLYQNTGASQVTELALIISHYNEYLNALPQAGQKFEAKGIQLNVSVGSDFFAEIAKLRALRKLLGLVHQTYGIGVPVSISCTTSRLLLTSRDAYTNLLRSTTQAMSAVLGGCNSLYVLPFDEQNLADNPGFSRRMARNQQIILKEESYLDKVADMGSGSYYIETLTEALATKAFELFKSFEAKGGFLQCLKDGLIQELVETEAEELRLKAEKGELVIIGANKYPNPNDRYTRKPAPAATGSTPPFKPLKALWLVQAFETQQPAV